MSVFIVAEIGVNHGKNLEIAKALVDHAIAAQVDAVKFQLWEQKTFPHLEHLRLEPGHIEGLARYAEFVGLKWFCTAFDAESVEFLGSLEMKIWKIPSNPKVFYDLNLSITMMKHKVENALLSLGLVHFNSQVDSYLRVYRQVFYDRLIPLYCVSQYPATPMNTHLHLVNDLKRLMVTINPEWKVWGISDHSGLPEIPIAAVALGAKVVECHITLDKDADGPDHKASLTPDEFAYMVRAIRNVEKAIA